jgi:hypothetical protein
VLLFAGVLWSGLDAQPVQVGWVGAAAGLVWLVGAALRSR